MITRRASEIIRLALAMSQIQNTDALSWRDKVDMLNQSYVRLYDDLNNNGDLYYAKEVQFSKPDAIDQNYNKMHLPEDFWKLLLVGYRSSRGEIVPIERAPNTGQYFSGYRIINNDLIFNNYFTPGPLVVRYIPQPQTITFPRPGYSIQGNQTQAAYDSLNDVIVLGGSGGIYVINNKAGTITPFMSIEDEQGAAVMFVFAISNGIIYVVTENGITCYTYDLSQIGETVPGEFDLYAHTIGWETGIIAIQNGQPYRFAAGSDPVESPNYWNFMEGNIYAFNALGSDASFSYKNSETGVEFDITEIFQDNESFVIADPYIYINKAGSVKVYEEFAPTDIAPAIIGRGRRKGAVLAAEANNESGYGLIFRDFYTGLSVCGFAADTVMNYPQNIFFDWLIADLAVKFRIALDIPTGELPALADDYHDTLMKGLSRDTYQTARINNVYGRAYL